MDVMMYWHGDDMNGWGFVLAAVGMVLFWGLLALVVVALVRHLGRRDRSTVERPDAEQVLAERFAGGDIDETEYRQRLDVLDALGMRGGENVLDMGCGRGAVPGTGSP
jgi:putative membrane protein